MVWLPVYGISQTVWKLKNLPVNQKKFFMLFVKNLKSSSNLIPLASNNRNWRVICNFKCYIMVYRLYKTYINKLEVFVTNISIWQLADILADIDRKLTHKQLATTCTLHFSIKRLGIYIGLVSVPHNFVPIMHIYYLCMIL